MRKAKKYDSQTGGYKIQLFVDKIYYCSIDTCKTCKQAKQKLIDMSVRFPSSYPTLQGITPNRITAKFFYP